MANVTLTDARNTFRQAHAAFEIARRSRTEALAKLRSAQERFDRAQATKDAVAESYQKRQDELATLKKALDDTRTEYEKTRTSLDSLKEKYKSAERSGKTKANKPGDDPDLRKLETRAEEDKLGELESRIKSLELDVAEKEAQTERLNQRLKDADDDLRDAEVDLENVRQGYEPIEDDFGRKKQAHDAASKDLDDIRITDSYLWSSLEGAVGSARVVKAPDFLTISTPRKEIDSIAAAILRDLAADGGVLEEQVANVMAAIKDFGIATEVSNVTKAWNRKRIPEAALFVLSATYLQDLGAEIRAAGKNAVDPQRVFNDTTGIVEAIRIRQQDPKDGALRKFAERLVDQVAIRKSLDLSDLQAQRIADQIFQKILY